MMNAEDGKERAPLYRIAVVVDAVGVVHRFPQPGKSRFLHHRM